MRFFRTPAEDAGGLNTGSGGRSRTSPQRRGKKMKGAMSNLSGLARSHEQWARFRFSVIGPSLAAPPERGDLQEELKSLAAKNGIIPSADNGFNYSSVVRFMKVQGLIK